jgi:hypothetical protein
MRATCTPTTVTLDLGRGEALQYIYNQGYSYRAGQTGWTALPYTSQESLIVNAWYPRTAQATLNLDSTQQATDTYVLGYVCTWTNNQWKCGCRDNVCTQSYWQIQNFRR